MANNWYDDNLKVRDFSTALESAGVVDDASEVLKRPYRYDEEYKIWKKAGYPTESDEEWEDFVNSLSEDEEDEEDNESNDDDED